MAKTRALRRRIRSVESISQVTRTMEMVSTSKLKRAQDRVVGARPYARALAEVIGDLLSMGDPEARVRAYLARLGYADAIKSAPAKVTGQLEWAGAPSDFASEAPARRAQSVSATTMT